MKSSKISLLIAAVVATLAYTPAMAAPEKTTARQNDSSENRPEAKAPQRSAAEQQAVRKKTRCLSCRILM